MADTATLRKSPSGPFTQSGSGTLVSGVATITATLPTGAIVNIQRTYTGSPTTTHWGALGVKVGATTFEVTSSDSADVSTFDWTLL